MPIEIKELHIRITVAAASEGEAPGASSSRTEGTAGQGASVDQDALVAECVEQVLQILQAKRER